MMIDKRNKITLLELSVLIFVCSCYFSVPFVYKNGQQVTNKEIKCEGIKDYSPFIRNFSPKNNGGTSFRIRYQPCVSI